MEQIKRANKLFTNDCIFLRKTLNIPVVSEKPLLFNGLNSLESPENEAISSPPSCEDDPVTIQEDRSSPSPQESDNHLLPPEELSAKDFLHRLDLQIKLSKQAARKLKPEDTRYDLQTRTEKSKVFKMSGCHSKIIFKTSSQIFQLFTV